VDKAQKSVKILKAIVKSTSKDTVCVAKLSPSATRGMQVLLSERTS
jgi:hypothetical protein